MNILPKKSWHVLSRPNVERVRRDEAAAKAKEEEKAERALLAEQEARVTLMRKRARERFQDEVPEVEERQPAGKESGGTEGGHINFFSDVEKGVGLRLTNVEHEAEKKAEQEKVEKRIGLLNYLVDKDKSDPEPWYMRSKDSRGEPSAKSEHRKQRMDPLTEMKHYVSAKKKCLEAEDVGINRKASSSRAPEREKEQASYRCKHKKGKSSSSELERLRKERRKREEAERARAEALMRSHYCGESSAGTRSVPAAVDETPGRYNSQYNPHLARRW